MAIVEPCCSGHVQEGKPTRRGGHFEDACYNGRVVGTIKHRCRGQSSLRRVHSYTFHGYIAGLHRAPLSTGALHGGGDAWRIADFSYTLSQHEYSARYGASSGRWDACDLAFSGANYQSHLIRCRSIRHRVSRRSFGGLGDDERYLLNKFCAANELLG
jgi:hypothetical protein